MPSPLQTFSEDEGDIVKVSPPASTAMTPMTIEDEKKPHVAVKQEKADVQAMVDDTVRRVREQSDRRVFLDSIPSFLFVSPLVRSTCHLVQARTALRAALRRSLQAAATPYADATRSFAEDKPVFFTFLAIFTLLSMVPIGIFAACVLSATVAIVGFALVFALLSVLGTVLFASTLLLPVLFVTTLISLCILTFLLALFLVHRLYLHVQLAAASDERDMSLIAGPNGADMQVHAGGKRHTSFGIGYDQLSRGVKSWLEETSARVSDGLALARVATAAGSSAAAGVGASAGGRGAEAGWKGGKGGAKWGAVDTQGESDATPRVSRVAAAA